MAKPIQIIGLTGYAGSGKDTVRNILESDHGFTGMAFADPIRSMVYALFNTAEISVDHMHERELKEKVIQEIGASYRMLAQTLGTEWGRSIHPDFWTRIAASKIDETRNHAFGEIGFVISDVRFPNEVEMIRSRGGQIWRIDRPGIDPVRQHASEDHVASMTADRIIDNSGSIDALWCKVSELVEGATA